MPNDGQRLSIDNAPQLLELIQASSHPTQGRQALDTLQQWEKVPGYCTLLLTIIQNRQIDANIRFVAISCFKNVVHRFWLPRSKGSYTVPSQEKGVIRDRLPELFDEENHLNALHIALLYAKIARADYPNDWPESLQILIRTEEDPNSSALRKLRVLQIMKFTIKSLSTKRLHLSRCHFEKATPELLQCVSSIWGQTNQQVLQAVASGNAGADAPTMEACKLSLQAIRPLLLYGVPLINQNQTSTEIISHMLHSLREYIQHIKQGKVEGQLREYIQKYIIVMCKTLLELHKNSPGPFEPFLVPTLELMWGELTSLTMEIISQIAVLERVAVYCLRFIKNVLSIHYSATPKKTRGRTQEQIREEEVIRSLMTPERITGLAEMIVSRFFRLTKEDFELWETDPEEVVSETASDDFCFQLRPAAQALFSACQSNFDEALSAHTIRLLQSVACTDGENFERVLLREACYQALGLSYDTSYANIPFQSWLNEFFMRDLNHSDRRCFMILARRIAWLLGCWVSRIPSESRPAVYEILLKLMADNDLVVQMTAAHGLSQVIDDLNFDIQPFAPYVSASLQSILALTEKVDEVSSQMQLINILSIIIEQAHSQVFPFSSQIVQFLAQLWGNIGSNEQGMMRSAVIRSIDKLVVVLEHRSADYYDTLLPIVRTATDITQAESIYTIEDGLTVWSNLLRFAPSPNPGLLELFPNLTRIIGNTFEQTEQSMQLLESYFLLGGETFISSYGQEVLAIYNAMLGDVNENGTALVIKSMRVLIECFPQQAPQFLEDMLVKVLGLLFSAEEPISCKKEYAILLCYVIVFNAPYFMHICRGLQATHQTTILPGFVQFLSEMMERERDQLNRKLVGLSLCELLPVGGPEMAQQLPQVVDIVLSVMADEQQTSSEQDLFGLDDDEDEEDDDTTGSALNEKTYQLYLKRRAMQKEKIQTFAMNCIQKAIQQYGEPFQKALENVPRSMLQQLQENKA